MKKLRLSNLWIALCLVMMAGVWSCNDEDVEGEGPVVATDPTALTFEAAGGAQELYITSNREWKITVSEPSFVSVSPASGNNEGKVTVTLLANDKAQRTAKLTITASTETATVDIVQKAGDGSGEVSTEALYKENCGSDVYKINTTTGEKDDDGRWPYVDQYTQYFNPSWEKGGTLDQTGIVYGGSGSNVSNSGATFDPPTGGPFSGAPYVGMNNATSVFTISDINITGKTNFTFKFGVVFQENYSGGSVLGAVTVNSFVLEASVDGNIWSPLTYTVAQQLESHWYMGSAEFKVPDGSTKLFIRYKSSNLTSNQGYRFDDFKLYEGGNGELLGQGGGDVPQPVNAIFYEACGSVATVKNTDGYYPYIDEYAESMTKGGAGATNVTYKGNNATIRPSMSSEGYEGASGVNSIFFGTNPSYAQINDINLGTAKKLILSFGISHADATNFTTVATEDVNVEVSNDGNVWKKIPYTISGTGWVLVSSEFAVPSTVTTLSLKFTVPTAKSVIRIDDIKLIAGGNGQEIDFSGEPVVEQSKTISDILTHWKAGNAAPESGWKIKGAVVSDKDGGNIQPYQFAMQDGNGENCGVVISYVKNEPNPTFSIGDTVSVDLTGASYTDYNGLLQITMTADKVSKVNSGPVPQPLNITVNQLKTGNYTSMLVSVDNVELVDKNVATMSSNNGNVVVKSGTDEFTMRTTTKAVFKDEATPKGVGTLLGIAGVYNSDYQISPRNKEDYAGMKSSVISFGTPIFTGTLKAGTAAANAKILIPYFDAQGTEGAYQVSVVMTGASAGLTVSSGNYTVSQAGNGTIEVPVTGTPTAAGEVTFTISGCGTDKELKITVSEEIVSQGVYSTGFEDSGEPDDKSNNNYTTEKTFTLSGIEWKMQYSDIVITGSPAVGKWQWFGRIAKNTTNIPVIWTNENLTTSTGEITTVDFKATGAATMSLQVYYSLDEGQSWNLASVVLKDGSSWEGKLSTSYKDYVATINKSGAIRLKFTCAVEEQTTTNRDMKLDEIVVNGTK